MVLRAMTLAHLNLTENQILLINFVGPKTIKRVNSEFVKHNGLTDVIAFDYREGESFFNDSVDIEDEIAAELFIYPGAAETESKFRKTSYAYELTLYIVHGILHLAGEDDLEVSKRKRMRRRERSVMKKLLVEFDIENIFINKSLAG